jgi:hypothetical protein
MSKKKRVVNHKRPKNGILPTKVVLLECSLILRDDIFDLDPDYPGVIKAKEIADSEIERCMNVNKRT